MLCELETDKVSVEVPAPAAGVLGKSWPPKAAPFKPAANWRSLAGTSPALPPQHRPALRRCSKSHDVEDAPSAKKLMSEAGLSRDDVTATGKDNRVMKQDVQQASPQLRAAPGGSVPPATPFERRSSR